MPWRSALTFFLDGLRSDGAPVVLRYVISSIHYVNIDSGEEFRDVGDNLAGALSIIDEILVHRVPRATELSGRIGIGVAFPEGLRISIDDIGSRRVGLNLDDRDGMGSVVVAFPDLSPNVGMFFESASGRGTTAFKRADDQAQSVQ